MISHHCIELLTIKLFQVIKIGKIMNYRYDTHCSNLIIIVPSVVKLCSRDENINFSIYCYTNRFLKTNVKRYNIVRK